MAREIRERLTVRGWLVAVTPLHVGGFGQAVETDLPLARDGQGRSYIPGTSLAGPLRHWCAERFRDEALIDTVWGFQDGSEGHASHVLIEDASIALPGGAAVEIRDGVGIDRVHGGAAAHIKYDRAILPRGTLLPLEMTVEVPCDRADETKAMIGHLLAALEAGEVRLGAARTRGLGRVRLDGDAEIRSQDLASKAGILALLDRISRECRGGDTHERSDLTVESEAIQPADLRDLAIVDFKPWPRLAIEIAWEPDAALMVKAGYEGVAVDALPLLSGRDDALAPVLPGSSIKGVLRGQAERIVRTVRDAPADRKIQDGLKRFLEHVRVPLVESLFGSAGESGDERLGLGALAVDDCFAEQSIPRHDWGRVESAEDDAALRTALSNAGCDAWSHAYHVAIDRWTGGAADQLLFTSLEPREIPWDKIRLTLDLHRLDAGREPALALLLLVLRDLAEGRLPLGFDTNRGLGSIRVTSIRITGSELDDGLSALASRTLAGEDPLGGLPADLRGRLSVSWNRWIDGEGSPYPSGTTP